VRVLLHLLAEEARFAAGPDVQQRAHFARLRRCTPSLRCCCTTS
jgi:hypothetical protein